MKNGILMFAVLAFGPFSCESEVKAPQPQPGDNPNYWAESVDHAYVLKEKAAWEKGGVDHYRFTAEIPCSTIPSMRLPISITVVPRKEPEMWYDKGKYPRHELNEENPFFPMTGKTITEIYEYIDSFVKEHGNEQEVIIAFTSNEKYHYPEHFGTAPRPKSPKPEHATGGGVWRVEVTEFEDLR